jgi:hemerythrin
VTFVEWSDDFKVGNRDIDIEHWGLFALVNDLADKVHLGAGDSSIAVTIDALVGYVDAHFEREEELMKECGYPDFDDHLEAHHRLRGSVEYFHNYYRDTPEKFPYEDFLEFLKEWLTRHIMKVDMAYVPYLKNTATDPS